MTFRYKISILFLKKDQKHNWRWLSCTSNTASSDSDENILSNPITIEYVDE